MGTYEQCHERYCFVTLTFNFKVLVAEDCWLHRKSADSTVMDRKKAVVSYKPTPAEI